MRVLYVSKALVVGAYRDKLRALDAHVRVRGVIPDRWGAQPVDDDEAGQVPIERCPALLHGHNHLHVYRGIGRLLDRDPPDLVHIDEEPYSAVAFQVATLCSRRGIPCLVFAWQNLHKRLPPPFGTLRAAVFRRIAGAIAGTQAAADVLRRAGYDKPLAIIPQFGVDPDRYRPDPCARACHRSRLGIGETAFVVGFAGRLVREKGVHLLMSAFRDLPAHHLVLLGDGPEREALSRMADSPPLRGRVHFVGHVASREVPGWLAAFDVLTLPSLSGRGWTEQFGRILVESMACGVPVVGSDSGEIPRVIGNAGIVVREGDERALRIALEGLAASPGARSRFAAKGRDRVGEFFTQQRVAASTAEFYRTLLEAS